MENTEIELLDLNIPKDHERILQKLKEVNEFIENGGMSAMCGIPAHLINSGGKQVFQSAIEERIFKKFLPIKNIKT